MALYKHKNKSTDLFTYTKVLPTYLYRNLNQSSSVGYVKEISCITIGAIHAPYQKRLPYKVTFIGMVWCMDHCNYFLSFIFYFLFFMFIFYFYNGTLFQKIRLIKKSPKDEEMKTSSFVSPTIYMHHCFILSLSHTPLSLSLTEAHTLSLSLAHSSLSLILSLSLTPKSTLSLSLSLLFSLSLFYAFSSFLLLYPFPFSLSLTIKSSEVSHQFRQSTC